MNIDPNVYALNVELSLDTSGAFDSFNTFEQKFEELTDNISNLVSKAFADVSGITDSISNDLGNIAQSFSVVNDSSTSFVESLGSSYESLSMFNDTIVDTLSYMEKHNSLMEEYNDFMKSNDDIYEGINKLQQDELKLFEGVNDSMTTLMANIETKNDLHRTENKLVRKERGELDLNSAKVGTIHKIWKDITSTVSGFIRMFSEATKDTDIFTQANYRLYGSQQELANQTRILSAENSVLLEKSQAAYKQLADIKYPSDQIGQLSVDVTKLSEVTGMTTETMVGFSQGMKIADYNAQDVTRHLTFLASAQRTLGLSQRDMNSIMNDTNLSLSEQILYFGKDAPMAFDTMAAGLNTMKNEFGGTEKEVSAWLKTLQATGAESIMLWQILGGLSAEQAADETQRYNSMGKVLESYAKQLGVTVEQIAEGGLSDPILQERIATLNDTYGVTASQMQFLANATVQMKDGNSEYLQTFDSLNKEIMKNNDLNKMWLETQATLYKQFAILGNSLNNLYKITMQLGSYVIIPLVQGLNLVVQGLVELMEAITMVAEAFGWFGRTIVGVGVVVGAIYGQFAPLSTGFTGIFSNISKWFGTITGKSVALSKAATTVGQSFTAVGGTVKATGATLMTFASTTLQAIGTGILRFGKLIQKVMVPMLALGGTMLMVGGAAYLFASSVKMIADTGENAIYATLGLSAALAAIVVAAVLAAGPIGGAAGAIAAFGGALLLAAGAAYVLSSSMRVASEAFVNMVEAVNALEQGALESFGAEFRNAAWDISIGSGYLLLALPAKQQMREQLYVISTSISALSDSIESMKGSIESFPEVMNNFKNSILGLADIDYDELKAAADDFSKSVKSIADSVDFLADYDLDAFAEFTKSIDNFMDDMKDMSNVGDLFKEGIESLNAGVTAAESIDTEALRISSEKLADVGWSLLWNGTIFSTGAGALSGPAKSLGEALIALSKGVTEFGAIDLEELTEKLNTGSTNLIGVGPRLNRSLRQFEPVIDIMYDISGPFKKYSASFAEGANALGPALDTLNESVNDLDIGDEAVASISKLDDITRALTNSAPNLSYAASQLSPGARELLSASANINESSTLLESSIDGLKSSINSIITLAGDIGGVGSMIASGSQSLLDGAISISVASSLLSDAARELYVAGVKMLPSVATLAASSYVLSFYAESFEEDTDRLVDAGANLLSFARNTESSMKILDNIDFSPLYETYENIGEVDFGNIVIDAAGFSDSVDLIVGPIGKLTSALADLNSQLTSYAENIAELIESNVVGEIVPVVKIMTEEEGSKSSRMEELAVQQNITLAAILTELQSKDGESGDVEGIIGALSEVISNNNSNLNNPMMGW